VITGLEVLHAGGFFVVALELRLEIELEHPLAGPLHHPWLVASLEVPLEPVRRELVGDALLQLHEVLHRAILEGLGGLHGHVHTQHVTVDLTSRSERSGVLIQRLLRRRRLRGMHSTLLLDVERESVQVLARCLHEVEWHLCVLDIDSSEQAHKTVARTLVSNVLGWSWGDGNNGGLRG